MRRTKEAAKAFKENQYISNRRVYNSIPPTASIIIDARSRRIPIVTPKFKSKEEYEHDNDGRIFVEMTTENRGWLNEFAASIVETGHMDEYSFYNSSLDVQNPGVSAFRVYAENNCFAQVQVRKVPNYPTLFQLDYFESNEPGKTELKLIALCNLVNYEHPLVDVIYYTYYDESKALDFGSIIGTNFQDVLIYMRPWDYSCGGKSVVVEPIEIPCWQ